MNFIFSSFFWGFIIILLGLSIIFRAIFHIRIPFFSLVFALIFIYIGLKILFGAFGIKATHNTIIFSDSKIEAQKSDNNYNVIFGKGVIDLSNLSPIDRNIKVDVNTIFGEGIIKINPEIPTIIQVNSVFAGARMPEGSVAALGSSEYRTKSFIESKYYLKIKASVVFGELRIIEKSPTQ
ncbi:MAG: hypothetical protein KAW92_02190 [Candidatus Cloacimonetes bacterium]|nr:hypothetical protein [Candidatus Cloacimonadota bacterium]